LLSRKEEREEKKRRCGKGQGTKWWSVRMEEERVRNGI